LQRVSWLRASKSGIGIKPHFYPRFFPHFLPCTLPLTIPTFTNYTTLGLSNPSVHQAEQFCLAFFFLQDFQGSIAFFSTVSFKLDLRGKYTKVCQSHEGVSVFVVHQKDFRD